MKKQAFRKLAMLCLFLMLAVASIHAQSNQGLVARIPFEFAFGHQTLPAGTYSVKTFMANGALFEVRNEMGGHRALTYTIGVEANRTPEQSMLVFHRYGDKYFLFQIWSAGEIVGRELSKSRAERTIERNLSKNSAKREQAKNTPELQIVTLIASR
jgi:hypothetical protein